MTSPRRAAGPARGLLRERVPDGVTEHRRILPHEALAPFVAHFWWVRWALRTPFTAETLPHPTVHLVFEESREGATRAEVCGVSTGRFSRRLAGTGQVFGVKFRPAAFEPFLRAPVSSLTDRVVAVRKVLGDEGDALAHAVASVAGLEGKIAVAESFLVPRLPRMTAEVARLRDLVERMATDRAILRAEDGAALVELDIRALQRRFRRYVGVSPKWVIQRYRLHEAAEQLKARTPPSLAALAAELGYFDQAHFARDFRLMVGRTPREFAVAEGGARR
jgi:AraC-like DNA-binding protein